MNKKYMMFGLLGLFAVAMVSAGLISYYGQVEQDINIDSPISIDGLTPLALNGYLVSPVLSEELVTVKNLADFNVDVSVESISTENGIENYDIVTNYVNTLELTTKNTDTWEVTDDFKATITYTVVGDKFVVNGIPKGYTLVYYPDTTDGWNSNLNNAIVLVEGSNEIPSLPIEMDIGDDYCNVKNTIGELSNPYATVCDGAKLWLIPGDDGIINWNNADTFLFETDLINYFKTEDGIATIPAGTSMEFTPMYEFGNIEGDYTVTTNIIPVAA